MRHFCSVGQYADSGASQLKRRRRWSSALKSGVLEGRGEKTASRRRAGNTVSTDADQNISSLTAYRITLRAPAPSAQPDSAGCCSHADAALFCRRHRRPATHQGFVAARRPTIGAGHCSERMSTTEYTRSSAEKCFLNRRKFLFIESENKYSLGRWGHPPPLCLTFRSEVTR